MPAGRSETTPVETTPRESAPMESAPKSEDAHAAQAKNDQGEGGRFGSGYGTGFLRSLEDKIAKIAFSDGFVEVEIRGDE